MAAGPAAAAASHRGGDGTPLVCIHGFSATWRVWTPVLPAFEAQHDVLAVTLPGHFEGAALPDGVEPSVEAIVDAVERDLDAAGFATAHLVGNSLGGWVALALAARGRARSVVALSPAGGWRPRSLVERRILTEFLFNYWGARSLAPYADRLMRRPRLRTAALLQVVGHPRRVPPAAAAEMIRGAAGCTLYLEFLEAVRRGGGYPAELGPIDVPVRIAWAERDLLLPLRSCSAGFRDLVPGAEWVTLPDVGHVPTYDDPELVARTVLELTARAEARAPQAA